MYYAHCEEHIRFAQCKLRDEAISILLGLEIASLTPSADGLAMTETVHSEFVEPSGWMTDVRRDTASHKRTE